MGTFLAPFWYPFGAIWDPVALFGDSLGSFGVPLGLPRVPLSHFGCPSGIMGASLVHFMLYSMTFYHLLCFRGRLSCLKVFSINLLKFTKIFRSCCWHCWEGLRSFCKTITSDFRQRSYVLLRAKRSAASPLLRKFWRTPVAIFEHVSKCYVFAVYEIAWMLFSFCNLSFALDI